MLSFHSLHSLYAELSLLAIGLLVFAYRFVGSNEWLKTHGLVLVAYYAVGGLVYDELEGWKLLDTAYFLTVTITTVGYGDICPETPEGKMFTVFYALVGIVFVFAALSPLVDALMFVKDMLLKPITPKEPTAEDCDDGSFDIDDLRKGGNWTFKYAAALAGPGLIFVLGLMIGFFIMDYDLIDGVYWSMITMTTIGYGDLSASTGIQQACLGPCTCSERDCALRHASARPPPPAQTAPLLLPPQPLPPLPHTPLTRAPRRTAPPQIVLMIYLPTAVAALADALGVVQAIGTAKMLCETDFAAQADKLLLGEAGGANPNPDETLTEAEFLISILKDNGIVDEITVTAIRLQFAHIVRHDTSSGDNKVLDDKMVFLEMKAQGRIVQTEADAPATTAAGFPVEQVNLNAPDGGFAEWRKTYWWPRVFDGATYGSGEVRSADCAATAASQAAAQAGFVAPPSEGAGATAVTKTVSSNGETKTFAKLEDTFDPSPPPPVEVTKAGAGDTGLWLLLLVMLALFGLQIYRDSLPPLPAADKYEGWALADVQEGDTLTPQMIDELSRLMVRRR